MKILQVISSLDPAGGGPVEAVRQLGVVLGSLGHRVEVVSLDAAHAPYLQQLSLPVHPLGPAALSYGFTARLVPWLRSNRAQYDVVVVNGIWQFHSLATWRALRGSTTPYVVLVHGMLDPWFKRRYPLKHLKKCLYWPWAEYRVLRDSEAVLFTCEEERLLARSSFWPYRCKEVVVGFGTSIPQSDAQSQLQFFFSRYSELRNKRLALFMGRIHPKKGCDLLIEAFARVLGNNRNWHLIIAGPDQVGWRSELQARAERLDIASRLTWAGMMGGDIKWGALRAAELFILPSHQENFGIAVAEALAVGLPVLISSKVNIWREIQADGAGLVGEDTENGICQILQAYLEMPQEKKLAMRQHASKCFEQRFDISKAATTLETVLCGVTSSCA